MTTAKGAKIAKEEREALKQWEGGSHPSPYPHLRMECMREAFQTASQNKHETSLEAPT
jgi:hypothetical protein